MEKRTCPKCGLNNYSEDTKHDWNCHTCGALIKKYRLMNIKPIIRNGKVIGYVGKNF